VSPINSLRFASSLVDDLRQPRGYLTLLVLLVASQLPRFIPSEYVHMLILTYIIGVAAIAWNIIGGFGGQFSLGNSVFFGVSAYTLGVLMVQFEFGFVPAALIAIGLSLVTALLIGYPSFQLTGHYFALATITVVEGMRFLVRYFNDFTGGAQGYSLVPALTRGVTVLDLERNTYYLIALGLFVFAFLVSVWVRRSKVGYFLMALRDDQLAAASIGINVPRFKMIGWIVTACLTALAGIMYAVYIQFLSPGFSFSITQSVLYAVIPIIGGIGTIAGPVIGTLLMVPLEHISQTEFGGTYGAITYVVYGIILILLIIYAPEGLRPKLKVVADPLANALPTFGDPSSDDDPQSDESESGDD
jgi:branched-chain amino acid transport system permease protein